MIIVKIQGGLGNQMFQVAFGESLRKRLNVNVFYDLSFFSNQKEYLKAGNAPRTFDLIEFFPNVAKIIKDNVIDFENQYVFLNRILSRVGIKLSRGRFYKLFKDPQNSYIDPNSLGKYAYVYCTGYWQNVKYFRENISELFLLFQFEEARKILSHGPCNKSSKGASVSLHIRRGDYLNSSLFTSLGFEYYSRAIEYVLKRAPGAEFFVFTDDVKWVTENTHILSELTPQISVCSTSSAYSDLYLMSRCEHHILSNSTYSWWAAYLNQNKRKLVIAPKQWTYDKKINDYIKNSLLDGITII